MALDRPWINNHSFDDIQRTGILRIGKTLGADAGVSKRNAGC